MDYHYEKLDAWAFQQLCQSLLIREYPGIQVFPTSQPDGGRDATWRTGVGKSFVAFQVKHVQAPRESEAVADWLERILNEEAPKVTRLVSLGAQRYIILTNAAATTHLGKGTLDRVQAFLDAKISIPAQVWWRDDLNRRLDLAPDLKWTYPAVMSGLDALRLLVELRLSGDQARRALTLRSYLTDQYQRDLEVRFKQVELQSPLLDLFVDVPVVPNSSNAATNRNAAHSITAKLTRQIDRSHGSSESIASEEQPPVGAAALLLDGDAQTSMPLVVLEGAPGQGKSTITQLVCQVHRMRLLDQGRELVNLAAVSASGPLRLPIRIELRDYAAWLRKEDPFRPGEAIPLNSHWNPSVESFIAAHVEKFAGGGRFDVDDLRAVQNTMPVLLVLDGLDEVADIEDRKEVVHEIEAAVARMARVGPGLQVIVSSRPTAFASSPGPDRRRFAYWTLADLSQPLISEYADRWLRVRRLSPREEKELRSLLQRRLGQAPLIDLARNPMQLSILLSLVLTRGASIPDKRTALYDAYMDVSFNREAEKSKAVREYRELLFSIHGYLGWLLQAQAESGGESGRIAIARLQTVLITYLAARGHPTTLVDELFHGLTERVVALVSRIQGTLEFEVQPVREYFAAKHLYETAPPSPPGNEQRGSRPERFDALARDPYWLNVTRFYAGCHTRGELAYLVDRLGLLLTDANVEGTGHPEQLIAMLIADWVFAQEPRLEEQALELLFVHARHRVLTAFDERANPLFASRIPTDAARSRLVMHVSSAIVRSQTRSSTMN